MDFSLMKIYIGRIKMEKQAEEKLNNSSESFFIVPFYYFGKKEFEKCISENWEKERSHNHWFLARHIDAFDKGKDVERIFTYYNLKRETYQAYGLPNPYGDIKVTSNLIADDINLPEQFTMRISQIKLLYFNTGFGFVIYKVDHREDEIELIINKSFALLRAFVPNRKSGKQVRLFALEPSEKNGSELTEKELNIIDITNKLLELKEKKNSIELFPISCKNQCYVYHRIQLAEQISDEEAQRYLFYLRKGFHSSFIAYDENSIYDFIWKQNKNLYWGGSMKGVVSLSYCIPGENNYFVTRQYVYNVRNDYFLLYMILLHQRQVLLYYNYLAVKEQNNMKRLEQIKKELIRFRINFAYKTVSDEASYQKFYHGMYECLSLESLNSDIQDVIDRITEYQDFANEKGMNRALALIAIFGIFSALADGIGFADTIMKGTSFTVLHWIIILLIIIIIIMACYTFIKNFFKK